MEEEYLLALLFPLGLLFLVLFFIFATAVAVYLKIFIQKRLAYQKYIASKYQGGISRRQIKSMRSFYIFYDFFMLIVLSLLTYLFPIGMTIMTLNSPLYVISAYLALIILLTTFISLDEVKAITRPRTRILMEAGSPQGIIIVWKDGSKFGYVYNFIIKYFGYIFLLSIIAFITLAFL